MDVFHPLVLILFLFPEKPKHTFTVMKLCCLYKLILTDVGIHINIIKASRGISGTLLPSAEPLENMRRRRRKK